MMQNESSKWMRTGIEALRKEFPFLYEDAPVIASRLAELLYERLPEATRRELGEAGGVLGVFGEDEPADASVGYSTFLERSRQALACACWEGSPDESEDLAYRTTDCFLRAAGRAMDESTRSHLRSALPHEIQYRMFIPDGQVVS